MTTALPPFCVHRTGRYLPDGVDHERASVGMKVIYRPTHGRPEVGVIRSLDAHRAFVLYLGDTIAKSTNLSDLTFWDGPE